MTSVCGMTMPGLRGQAFLEALDPRHGSLGATAASPIAAQHAYLPTHHRATPQCAHHSIYPAPSSPPAGGLLGLVGVQMKASGQQEGAAEADPAVGQEQQQEAAPPPPPREKAVLVLGATGRLGRRVVQKVGARVYEAAPWRSALGVVAVGGQRSLGQ